MVFRRIEISISCYIITVWICSGILIEITVHQVPHRIVLVVAGCSL